MISYNLFELLLFFDFLIVPIVLIKIVCILIAVAYFTIAERKVMAAIQRRVGPNVEGGPFGLLQPLADGLKLVIKELAIPNRANTIIFLLAPIIIFVLSLVGWSVIPFNYYTNFDFDDFAMFNSFNMVNKYVADIKFGLFFFVSLIVT